MTENSFGAEICGSEVGGTGTFKKKLGSTMGRVWVPVLVNNLRTNLLLIVLFSMVVISLRV